MGMLFRDPLLITPRAGASCQFLDIRIASIAVSAGKIVAIGPYAEVKQQLAGSADPAAVVEFDCRGPHGPQYLAMPGFVDAHSHSRQIALHGHGESGWRDPHSRPHGDAETAAIFRWFLADAAKAGVTFVCDWPEHPQLWHPRPMHESLQAAGMRGCLRVLLPHNRRQPSSPLPHAVALLQRTITDLGPTLTGIWIPEEDTPEFNDELLAWLGSLRQAMPDCPLVLQMHLAESPQRKQACSDALTRLRQHGLLRKSAARTLLVHAICLDPSEVDDLLVLRYRVGVVTCPKFAGGRLAPVKELLDGGVPVGLGSDVAAPDPLGLIGRLLAMHRSRPSALQLGVAEAINIATLQGARLFGVEDRLGSLEAGKDADIVLLRNPAAIDAGLFADDGGDAPPAEQQRQRLRVVDRLFTRSVLRREHIARVMVGSRLLVDNGRLTPPQDDAAIQAAGQAASLAIMRRMTGSSS
jgi:5-methylthioadenosine/S-adenosylhomocysteine deaminase